MLSNRPCGSLVHADNVRAYLQTAFEFGLHARTTTRWRGCAPDFSLSHNPVANTKKAMRRKLAVQKALFSDEVGKIWHRSGITPPVPHFLIDPQRSPRTTAHGARPTNPARLHPHYQLWQLTNPAAVSEQLSLMRAGNSVVCSDANPLIVP